MHEKLKLDTHRSTHGGPTCTLDCAERIKTYHIEGRVSLYGGDRELIGQTRYDLVDQLWAFLIDGVFKIEAGAKEWSTMFPDKSLRLALRRRGTKNLEFFIEDEPTYEITYRVFRGEVGRAGAVFSEQLCKLMLAAAELRPESAEKRRSIALG